jgi:hypothetical protein
MCQGKSSGSEACDLLTFAGGDFTKADGTGTFSIYGDKFPVSAGYIRLRLIFDANKAQG